MDQSEPLKMLLTLIEEGRKTEGVRCNQEKGYNMLMLEKTKASVLLPQKDIRNDRKDCMDCKVEPRIQEEQYSFHPGRGALDQLYTLHRVLEGLWEFAQPVHMCFVDLEKAMTMSLLAFCGRVYIPPSANVKEALCELYRAISELQNVHPDGLFIIAGDFNHANLKSVLPKFHQYVDFATRGVNALGLVYTNIPGAYRVEARPHLGYSDHISVMLIPAYRPLVRRSKPVLKLVKTWPEGAISALQDCFECTDWDMFRETATNNDTTDLEEYTSSVTSYISKCIDDVTISKSITTHCNQKPWMTAKVRALLKSRDSAFRARDKDALRTARAKLSRAIREAKHTHSQRIHGHFQSSGDTRHMWQGIQSITNYRPAPPACDSDASLPDALNSFYAQFETQNDVMARKTIPPPEDQVPCLTTADVRKTLCRVNPWKAAGPDNIPSRVLRECAKQLADVFTYIFPEQPLLSQCA
ncbi:hypothetical protein QTP70_002825 [Hemibagrus guttatus]|uniref:Uncharacterized protein n=1 Tax=Hemibagrus guttatus TaxID=175788 RepID=A0AAE0QS40_9TELE|nr:hypothetical protein QTP70_002825 [Hemibagrus guttatus]